MKTRKINLRQFRFYPILLLIGLLLLVLSNLGFLNPFISLAQKITLPLQIAFYRSGQGIAGIGSTVANIGTLRNHNSELSLENSTLKAENAKLKKLEEENSSLRSQLNTKSKTLKIKLVASVIGTGGFGTKSVLLVDKGSNDKVAKGDLVVVKDILIGKIINVSPNTSSIQLLTDPDTSIPVVTSGGAEGILEGRFGSGITLTNVVQSEDLTEKEIVFTSGKDGLPRNLVLGEIGKINKIEKEFFQTASVSELVSPKELKVVYLLDI